MMNNQSVTVIASRGYTPFTTFNNTLSSSVCTVTSAPLFSQLAYNITIPEDTPTGTVLLNITITNTDINDLTFDLSDTQSTFTILPDGDIVLSSSLNYEAINSYQVTVTATEQTTQRQATASVLIAVTDVNDNSPVVTVTDSISIPLNLPNGSLVFTVTATDADSAGMNSELRYSISNDPMMIFTIDELKGTAILQNQVSASAGSQYQLVVTVTDLGSPPLATSAVVNVTFVANLPFLQFNMTQYQASVSEGATNNTAVTIVTAEVQEPVGAVTISYYLSAPSISPFSIVRSTGEILLTGSVDREAVESYQLEVMAGANGVFPALAIVTITVVDINDNAPVFSMSSYTFTIAENSPAQQLSPSVIASDADSVAAVISYSLIGAPPTVSINSSTGNLHTLGSFDHEVTPLVTFTVVATDNGAPSLSSSVNVTIVITDLNDNPPIITPLPLNPSLPEDAPIGTIVTTLSITDVDAHSLNGPSMIQIVSGDSTHFNLSSNMVILSAPLDYESQQHYSLVLSAVDTSDTTLSSNLSLVVTVTDVNDNPPLFSMPLYEITVNESTPVNHLLLLIIVTDADTGVNAEVELFIVSGDDDYTFVLFDSGELLLNQSLDYETNSLYLLQIKAVNVAPNMLSSTSNVTVHVTDVNEFPPHFSQSVYQATITEGPGSNGVLVIIVTASDQDTADTISYSISASDFNISSSAGAVFSTAVFDREMVDQYSVEVLAVDSGSPPRSSSAVINVTIVDLNDNHPVFSSAVDSVNVSETAPVGDEVAIVNVTDADIGSNGQVSLSLVEDYSTWSLSSDGILSVTGPLNATNMPSYTLSIVAVDGGSPPLSSSAQLVITVQPLFPETPLFNMSVYSASVPENSPISLVTIVMAVSTDSELAVVYSFSPVTAMLFGSLFSINSSSGAVTTDPRPGDTRSLSADSTTTLNGQSSSNAQCTCSTVYNDHTHCRPITS